MKALRFFSTLSAAALAGGCVGYTYGHFLGLWGLAFSVPLAFNLGRMAYSHYKAE